MAACPLFQSTGVAAKFFRLDFPAGTIQSVAEFVSADGSVVVGWSSGPQFGGGGFRWTPLEGVVSLADLPGGGSSTIPTGISADGSVIVGNTVSASEREAFRWTQRDGLVGLGDLPGGEFASGAHGVSRDGSVIVGFGTDDDGRQAVYWSGREPELVALPRHENVTFWSASHVSANGRAIAGVANQYQPFRWTATEGVDPLAREFTPWIGTLRLSLDIDGISADGSAIAYTTDISERYQYLTDYWSEEGDSYEFSGSTAAMSENGVAVGWVGQITQTIEAFQFSPTDGLELLPRLAPDHKRSRATAVSPDASVIAGLSGTESGNEVPVIWLNGRQPRELEALLREGGADLTGWNLHEVTVTAISADGKTFVGWGYNSREFPEAFIAVIPEPSTLALAIAAGVLLVLWNRGGWVGSK